MRVELTDAMLRTTAAPSKGRVELADLSCRGLTFRVTDKDVRSFSFRFRDPVSAEVTRFTLGKYPDVRLAKARLEADRLRQLVASGINPVAEKRRIREEAKSRTFGAIAARYMREHAERHKKASSAKEDRRNLDNHVLPKWEGRRMDSIARRDVIELIEGLVSRGTPVLANRVHSLISKVFSFAVDSDLVGANPCAKLQKRGAEKSATRVLSDAELRLFWPSCLLSPVTRRTGLALRLALLTGARAGEVAGMTRSELENLKNKKAQWTIPGTRTKNGLTHIVPLNAMARKTISEALELIGPKEQFVFPSPAKAGQPLKPHSMTVAAKRLALTVKGPGADTMKADPPTPHDLRRTIGTRLSALGTPKEDRDAVLNHKRRDVGRVYDQYERLSEKRSALNKWEKCLATLLRGRA